MADYITAEEVLKQVRKMPIQERARLKDILYSDNEGKHEIKEGLTQKRFAEGRVCPHCGGHHVRKNGHQPDGTQKYVCVDCYKSFSITTKSIFFGTRKSMDVWQRFMKCMADGKSLDYCAHECGITHATAFAWRHKILDALSNAGNDTELKGSTASQAVGQAALADCATAAVGCLITAAAGAINPALAGPTLAWAAKKAAKKSAAAAIKVVVKNNLQH